MRILCLGGAGGLVSAISPKLRDASHKVAVLERNKANDTFDWGRVAPDRGSAPAIGRPQLSGKVRGGGAVSGSASGAVRLSAFDWQPADFARKPSVARPGLVARGRGLVSGSGGRGEGSRADGRALTPVRQTHANRVVVSPMAQSMAVGGCPIDWNFAHCAECTRGVMCRSCDAQAKICGQIDHSGRNGFTELGWEVGDATFAKGNWPATSASWIALSAANLVPKATDRADMDRVLGEFVNAAEIAHRAGFDEIELRAAHCFLLSRGISHISNTRTDAHGGVLGDRMRNPLEMFAYLGRHMPQAVATVPVSWQDSCRIIQTEEFSRCPISPPAAQ